MDGTNAEGPDVRFSLMERLRSGLTLSILIVALTAFVSGSGWHSAQAQILKEKPRQNAKEFGSRQNHLARESSPYLRMHSTNPVDWYPWGPEALQKALSENKPIFLSVGYSTCFWCHVMERQVFENEEIAAYMNEHFINIKVDREERPDIDDVYMTSLQVYFQLAQSTQGGGWPLSIFLTPDGKPIAGGTYFPPKETPGLTSFPTVLRQIQTAWKTRENDVRTTADLITREVTRLSTPSLTQSPVKPGPELVHAVLQSIESAYDPVEGGLDFDPKSPEGAKFPMACRLQLLQSQVGRPPAQGQKDPAEMLDVTLQKIAAGGIWDHLGGGFHRYATDRRWRVPHFEKMLYDNAQLAEIYVEAYRRTGRDQYRQTAEGIFEFVQRELTGPHGDFYSALDAETDGIEGAFYTWTKAELEKHLSAANLRIFTIVYGLDQPSALETGSVLSLPRPLPDVAETLGMPVSELEIRLAEMKKTMLAVRQKRSPLRKDDKVLTAWNGLMIRAYARGGQILKRQDYLEAASKAAARILAEHRDPNGGLLRINASLSEQQPAFLEDYAFLVSGLLALYDATHQDKWLNAARRLTDDQMSAFWDQKQGGFFFTSNRQEIVLTRLKNAYDHEMPSGNSVSVQNLVRLARLRSDETYRKHAEKTLEAFGNQLQDAPERSAYMAISLQEFLHWYGTPESQAAGEGLFSGGPSMVNRPRAEKTPQFKEARPDGDQAANASLHFPEHPGAIVQLLPDAESAAKSPHLAARGFLETDSLTPGKNCRLAIELVIEPGWHLNANPAQPDFLKPLTVSLSDPAGRQLQDIIYPQGEAFTVTGIDQPLSVYQGQVTVQATLPVPADASDALPVQIDVRVQLCNNQSCAAPTVLRLQGLIPISSSSQPARSVNQVFFPAASPPNAPRAFPVAP